MRKEKLRKKQHKYILIEWSHIKTMKSTLAKLTLTTSLLLTSCAQPQQAIYEPIHRFYQGGSLETQQEFYNNNLSDIDKQLLDSKWYYDQLDRFYEKRQNKQFKDLRFRLIPTEFMPAQTENKSRIA